MELVDVIGQTGLDRVISALPKEYPVVVVTPNILKDPQKYSNTLEVIKDITINKRFSVHSFFFSNHVVHYCQSKKDRDYLNLAVDDSKL